MEPGKRCQTVIDRDNRDPPIREGQGNIVRFGLVNPACEEGSSVRPDHRRGRRWPLAERGRSIPAEANGSI